MKPNPHISFKGKGSNAEVLADNPHYKLVLGKNIGGFIRHLDLRIGKRIEPLATNRLFTSTPMKTSEPSRLLLDVMNRRKEDWVQIQAGSFVDIKQTCEETKDKATLKFEGKIKLEGIPNKPELDYNLSYFLTYSPLIQIKMGVNSTLAEPNLCSVVSSLEFFHPGKWAVNTAEAVFSEDFVVRHPLQQSIYSERTGHQIVDRYWMSPLYPLSFNNPILGIENRNKTSSIIITDIGGSSRKPNSSFYFEADKLEGEWVLCFRALNLGTEIQYALLPQHGPLSLKEDTTAELEDVISTFNYCEPWIDARGSNYVVENQYIKAVFARNKGGCIKEVVMKSGSESAKIISESNLLVAEGIYDQRFFFSILSSNKYVDAAKCLTPFITQERRDGKLNLSFNGYFQSPGPASFSVPHQKIQYYIKYGFNSSSTMEVAVGIKPYFELKSGEEHEAVADMIANWLGFTPDYEKLFEKATVLFRLSLPNVEKYALTNEEGLIITSGTKKENKRIGGPKDPKINKIDIWHKQGILTSFTVSISKPESFKPSIYVVDGEAFDVCFAWLDEQPYNLEKDCWYDIGFKVAFKHA